MALGNKTAKIPSKTPAIFNQSRNLTSFIIDNNIPTTITKIPNTSSVLAVCWQGITIIPALHTGKIVNGPKASNKPNIINAMPDKYLLFTYITSLI